MTFVQQAAVRRALRLSLSRRLDLVRRHHPPATSKAGPSTPARASPATTTTTTTTTAAESTRPIWERLGVLSRAFQAYGRVQQRRPYWTQFVTSLVIYFCGDLSAQSIGGEDYAPERTLRMLLISAGSSVPAYRWFMYLEKSFNYSSKALSLATKVIVNQLVFTPIFNTYFFSMQALLAGEGVSGAVQRVKDTVPTSYTNSWKLWPAVTAISFAFIAPQYRFVFAGFIAVGWQTYLSFLNRTAETEEAAAQRNAALAAA